MTCLALIPAYNEAASLPGVVGELRRAWPELPVLVVDDGSNDATETVVADLDVRWLRLREHAFASRARPFGRSRSDPSFIASLIMPS
ncbi:MAG: glycosyltransferase [Candidatus Rokuibacteriota bacterium]